MGGFGGCDRGSLKTALSLPNLPLAPSLAGWSGGCDRGDFKNRPVPPGLVVGTFLFWGSLCGFVPARVVTGPAARRQSAVLRGWTPGQRYSFLLAGPPPDFGGAAGLQRGAEALLAPASGHFWGLWARGRWPSSQLDLWGQAPTGTRLWA